MNAEWYYRKQDGDAGLNRKPPRLKDLGEHSVEIFVREVIQNNLDAGQQGKEVSVSFKLHQWSKTEAQKFLEFLGTQHIEHLKKSTIDPDPSVNPYLIECKDILKGKDSKYFTVIVEEKNCFGLLGPIRSSEGKSHFDALMRKVENNEAKKETTNTGGTWGKGSSIFTYTSSLWTWFAYTKLSEPYYDANQQITHDKRFIGRCMIPPFFDSETNKSFLGDGWFCDIEPFNKSGIDAHPFINSDADHFANKLGIPIRYNEPGTTFFIPFFKPKMENINSSYNLKSLYDEFVKQVVQNWYIPIFNKSLSVTVSIDDDEIIINKNFLSSVPELKFKLQLLEWYSKGCPLIDKSYIKEEIEVEVPALQSDFLNQRVDFAKKRQKVKADLLIRLIDEDEDFSNKWDTVNKIALTRNKGMVINNEKILDHPSIRIESIFFGGLLGISEQDLGKRQHLDLFLAYSENPAHNEWCRSPNHYDRCFLDRFEGRRPKPEASINSLFNEFGKIIKKLVEDDSPNKSNKDICDIFKKIAKLKSQGPDPGGKTLLKLRKIDDRIDSEGRYLFIRRLISSRSDGKLEVSIKSFIDTLEGDKDKDFEILGISEYSHLELLNDKNEIISAGECPKIELEPCQEIIITIRTCKIDSNPNFSNIEPVLKVFAKKL